MKLFSFSKSIGVSCIAVAIFMATAFGSVGFASPVLANDFDRLAQAGMMTKIAEKSGLIAEETENRSLAQLIGRIIQPLLGVIGSLFFVLVVFSGVMWMTSAGNEERIAKAKRILSAAVVGLALSFLAYTIARYVLTSVIQTTTVQPDASGAGVCIYDDSTNPNCDTEARKSCTEVANSESCDFFINGIFIPISNCSDVAACKQ